MAARLTTVESLTAEAGCVMAALTDDAFTITPLDGRGIRVTLAGDTDGGCRLWAGPRTTDDRVFDTLADYVVACEEAATGF